MRVGLKSSQRCQRDTWRERQVKAETETGAACLPAKGHNIPAVPRSQERGMGPILLRLPQGINYANVFLKKKKKNTTFYINNVGIVSGGQQRYSAMHLQASILRQTPHPIQAAT